jgi:hypothetical protein
LARASLIRNVGDLGAIHVPDHNSEWSRNISKIAAKNSDDITSKQLALGRFDRSNYRSVVGETGVHDRQLPSRQFPAIL